MALLFVKNLLVRQERNYSPLRDADTHFDIEHSTRAPFLNGTDPRHSTDEPDAPEPSKEHDTAAATDEDTDHDNDDAAAEGANFRAHLLSNFTLGFSDGLTVPFAVTAGLSALGRPRVVIFGGLSELVAGVISMGMGGYLGAKGEADAYAATLATTTRLVHAGDAAPRVTSTLAALAVPAAVRAPWQAHLAADPAACIDFLMRFHHQLPPSSMPAGYALWSGLATAGGYLCGGVVPLLPYLVLPTISAALVLSVVITALVLLMFGAVKTWAVGERSRLRCLRGGVEMLLLGGTAAGAAVGCVKAFS